MKKLIVLMSICTTLSASAADFNCVISEGGETMTLSKSVTASRIVAVKGTTKQGVLVAGLLNGEMINVTMMKDNILSQATSFNEGVFAVLEIGRLKTEAFCTVD